MWSGSSLVFSGSSSALPNPHWQAKTHLWSDSAVKSLKYVKICGISGLDGIPPNIILYGRSTVVECFSEPNVTRVHFLLLLAAGGQMGHYRTMFSKDLLRSGCKTHAHHLSEIYEAHQSMQLPSV